MKRNLFQWLDYFNIPKHATKHLIGPNHTETHHKIAGGFIMTFGVMLVHLAHYFGVFFWVFVADIVGFALHGVGLIPFISKIEHETKSEIKNFNNYESNNTENP